MTSVSVFGRDDHLFGAGIGEDSLQPGSTAGDPTLGVELYSGPPVDQILWWGDDPVDEALSPCKAVDGLFVEPDGELQADLVLGGGASALGPADHEVTLFGHSDQQSEPNHLGYPDADGELTEADPIEFRFLEYALFDLIDGGDADAIGQQDAPIPGGGNGSGIGTRAV